MTMPGVTQQPFRTSSPVAALCPPRCLRDSGPQAPPRAFGAHLASPTRSLHSPEGVLSPLKGGGLLLQEAARTSEAQVSGFSFWGSGWFQALGPPRTGNQGGRQVPASFGRLGHWAAHTQATRRGACPSHLFPQAPVPGPGCSVCGKLQLQPWGQVGATGSQQGLT